MSNELRVSDNGEISEATVKQTESHEMISEADYLIII